MESGRCPKCKSDNIDYVNGPDFSDNEMWYEGYCDDCETDFQEIFEVKYKFSEITEKE